MTPEQVTHLLAALRQGIAFLRADDLDGARSVAEDLHRLLEGATSTDAADILAHDAVEAFITSLTHDPRDWERAASAFNSLVYETRESKKKAPEDRGPKASAPP